MKTQSNTNEPFDKKHLLAAAEITAALAEAIWQLGSIPSGHLYARLMSLMDLETYDAVIGVLVEAGVVRREPSHLLVWTGNAPKSTRMPKTKKARK